MFMCGNCGYVLHTFRSKMGRGLYHIPKIHKLYFGKCPACGKELKKPKRIEFKTLKEHKQKQNFETKASTFITARIPTWMYDTITKLVEDGKFKSKSEFIVKAILSYLEEHGLH